MKKLYTFTIVLFALLCSYAQKPNVIVFLVDDMGLMDTSVPFIADENLKPKEYELNTLHRTPNMEALSKNGTRFSRAYAMSVCSPSRVSIMTGQTSARHHVSNYIKPEANNGGIYGPTDWAWEGLNSKSLTMPKLLKEQGYKTIFIGKAHFAPVKVEGEDPLLLGYDVNIGGCAWGQPGTYLSTSKFGNNTKGKVNRGVPHLEKYYDQDIFLTEALTLEAIAEIKKAKKEGKPFLLSMSHYAVHSPFTADKRFVDNYKDVKAPTQWKAFASMIEGMDKSLGDIVKTLEDEGIADNTLIIFLGDNGTDSRFNSSQSPELIANAAPLRGMKATRFEGGMRIPFIVSWAKPNDNSPIQKEFKIEQNSFNATDLVAVYDVFSTVLDVAGAKTPANYPVDGKSVFDSNKEKDREFLMHFPHEHRDSYFTSYIKGNWKIIKHYKDSSYELFDLSKDMTEANNLFKTNPEKAKEMILAMESSLKNANAQYPDFSKPTNMLGKGNAKAKK
ncbi:MAG: sulfatase [Opitutales bacterium]